MSTVRLTLLRKSLDSMGFKWFPSQQSSLPPQTHAVWTASLNSAGKAFDLAEVLSWSAQATAALGKCQAHNVHDNFMGSPVRQSCSE